MKKLPFFFAFAVFFSLCSIGCSDDEGSDCEGTIGSEMLTYRYFNDSTPKVTPDPIDARGNIFYDSAYAVFVNNGVDIVVPGVRIRTDANNYEITRLKIDEKSKGEECFSFQFEFTNDQTSFQTDIASVLVLDMSTSLLDNIGELKEYAKNFANTVVNSSSNSTVAVVFFSDRDAIQPTGFYTSANIGSLNQLIDSFSNYQTRTALYQAVQAGVDLLDNLDFEGEKSLVAFTDGGDNDSNNPSQLVNQINASGVEKFAIGLTGADFQESNLESIVSQSSNFVVAQDINALEDIFKVIGRGVISVYEIRYSRSDQLLSPEEAVDVRISIESKKIE